MNYDDIFGDDIFNESIGDLDNYFDDLIEIFEKNGFNKQLMMLCLKCCDLVALNTIYSQLKTDKDKEEAKKKIYSSMGIIYTIIESFLAVDEEAFEIMSEVRDKYIEKELENKIVTSKYSNAVNNRIAHLFKNKKGE